MAASVPDKVLMAAAEVGLHCGFSVELGCCHQPCSRLSAVPNVLSLESKKANDCQPIFGPHDLAAVAPYRRSDPGKEIDLGVWTNVGRVPESESATDYELCGKPQRAFLQLAMNVEISGWVVRPRLV